MLSYNFVEKKVFEDLELIEFYAKLKGKQYKQLTIEEALEGSLQILRIELMDLKQAIYYQEDCYFIALILSENYVLRIFLQDFIEGNYKNKKFTLSLVNFDKKSRGYEIMYNERYGR